MGPANPLRRDPISSRKQKWRRRHQGGFSVRDLQSSHIFLLRGEDGRVYYQRYREREERSVQLLLEFHGLRNYPRIRQVSTLGKMENSTETFTQAKGDSTPADQILKRTERISGFRFRLVS